MFTATLSDRPAVTGSATVTTATAATAVTSCVPITVSATTSDVYARLAGEVTTVRWLAVPACLSTARDTGAVEATCNVCVTPAGQTPTVTGQCVHMTVTIVAIVLSRATRLTVTAGV